MAQLLEARYSERILLRRQYANSQTGRGREARVRSILNAFEVSQPEQLSGCSILLVDDVMTTGATLEGCGLALTRHNPCIDLYIATMAVVP